MTANNASRCLEKSTAKQFSFGHKLVAVALSAVMLGFGWPAVSPASSYAATERESVSMVSPDPPSIVAYDYEVEVGQSFDIVLGHVLYHHHQKWKSSDGSIATVKGRNSWGVFWGEVTGVKPGSVEIIYTWDQRNSGQLSKTYRVLVKKAPIAGRVTLTGTPASKTYDGKPLAAGTAQATDNGGHDVVIEYQKADGSWTKNPADITATAVADSTTVNVRASVPDYYDGYVTTTQALTIVQHPVVFSGDLGPSTKTDNGSGSATHYTAGKATVLQSGQAANVQASASSTFPGAANTTANGTAAAASEAATKSTQSNAATGAATASQATSASSEKNDK